MIFAFVHYNNTTNQEFSDIYIFFLQRSVYQIVMLHSFGEAGLHDMKSVFVADDRTSGLDELCPLVQEQQHRH